jgi:peptidoglycan/xylan/chitin deacetylase (PgdA/CDA1 family)
VELAPGNPFIPQENGDDPLTPATVSEAVSAKPSAGQQKCAGAIPKCALMLHSISEPRTREEAAYSIAPRRFHKLMRWFRTMGYNTIKAADWLADAVPAKRVLLTFDDGCDDLYTELLPVVAEHHYNPIVFLVADLIGGTNLWDQAKGMRARKLLTLEQICEMQRYGVEFGSHSATHPLLTRLSDVQLRREVSDSKYRLEDLLGVEVVSFAYPYGDVDERARLAVAEAGYRLAFTAEPGTNLQNDPLLQRRAEVNGATGVADFLFKLRYGQGVRVTLGALRRKIAGGELKGGPKCSPDA